MYNIDWLILCSLLKIFSSISFRSGFIYELHLLLILFYMENRIVFMKLSPRAFSFFSSPCTLNWFLRNFSSVLSQLSTDSLTPSYVPSIEFVFTLFQDQLKLLSGLPRDVHTLNPLACCALPAISYYMEPGKACSLIISSKESDVLS